MILKLHLLTFHKPYRTYLPKRSIAGIYSFSLSENILSYFEENITHTEIKQKEE
jgi:hypothetical protein